MDNFWSGFEKRAALVDKLQSVAGKGHQLFKDTVGEKVIKPLVKKLPKKGQKAFDRFNFPRKHKGK